MGVIVSVIEIVTTSYGLLKVAATSPLKGTADLLERMTGGRYGHHLKRQHD